MLGFLNVNKPPGMTSHDVVDRVRRATRVKKIGHAGTLDPLATGVLVLCVGAAARLSEYVMNSTKRYEARIHLGVTSTTYDGEGELSAQRDVSQLMRADVERALAGFEGEIDQLPPMHSAIQQGGRRLYELARKGQSVERTPRRVTIHALEILDWQPPQFTLAITCSAGTYIRSLAHDLGQALGAGAYLAGLTRTASGRFTLDRAVELDALLRAADWERYLIAPSVALADWHIVRLDAGEQQRVLHGNGVPGADAADATLALAVDSESELIAVLRAEGGVWKPHKVFPA